MPFPNPPIWNRETSDTLRENRKRKASPCSFFFSHGRSLCLAAEYFTDERLTGAARNGVAVKHRHKNQLALYGQLMAAFEYMLKDYVAKVIDATDAFDEKIKHQEWLHVTTDRILAQRVVQSTVGAALIHPTMGWHSPKTVNERFKSLFNIQPIEGSELKPLSTLWVLRHSVAHNAGFVTAHDAARMGLPDLAERVAHINDDFIKESFDFLKGIASRLANNCGKSVLKQWLKTVKEYDQDFSRDQDIYVRIKLLGECIESRTQDISDITEQMYQQDWQRYAS